jgi:AraC-like DNA-binding protein
MDLPGVLLTRAECVTLIRRALPAIGRRELGLELGMRSNMVSRGAQALGLLASATLGEAAAMAMRFPTSAGTLLDLHDERSGREHVMCADSLPGDLDVQPFLAVQFFSSVVNTRRQLATSDYSPKLVEFVHAEPKSTRNYELHFNCPVRFSSPRNRLVSDLRWLDYRLSTADLRSYRLAWDLQEREEAQAAGKMTIVLAVERAIRRQMPSVPSLGELAASLHLSERTLRRRLSDGGIGYQGLVDQIRQARALELILTSRTPLAQVAAQTGFSDVRALRRAFKRWTGQVPSALRS